MAAQPVGAAEQGAGVAELQAELGAKQREVHEASVSFEEFRHQVADLKQTQQDLPPGAV